MGSRPSALSVLGPEHAERKKLPTRRFLHVIEFANLSSMEAEAAKCKSYALAAYTPRIFRSRSVMHSNKYENYLVQNIEQPLWVCWMHVHSAMQQLRSAPRDGLYDYK